MLPHNALSVAIADRVRRDPQRGDAKAVEMRLPGNLIGEPRLPMDSQLVDDRPGKGASVHIVPALLG
jgi:hypothetical protein